MNGPLATPTPAPIPMPTFALGRIGDGEGAVTVRVDVGVSVSVVCGDVGVVVLNNNDAGEGLRGGDSRLGKGTGRSGVWELFKKES